MTIAISIFLLLGLFFFTVGVIGILRFPDFYSRLHAAGKSDSLAAVLVVIAVALYNLQDFSVGNLLVSIKILLIAVFIYVASPTATHAITKTALVIGVIPWSKGDKKS
ncbi:MAG: monovalent cation/H(+) antiporter subunit G [Desulfuromonadales bacterium]|nr:monovalent cation/H(+) antiporter subunit G [Desulfuromonadales bacterium]MBN2793259.1 monovalent cation/H(+) antiporter subunit G [Desulfuromonadales bacterium]